MRFHAFSTKRNWSLQTIKQQSNILYWSGFLSLDRPAVKAVVGNEDEGKKQKFCVEFAQCYYSSKFCRIAQSFIQLSFFCNDFEIRKQPTFHDKTTLYPFQIKIIIHSNCDVTYVN